MRVILYLACLAAIAASGFWTAEFLFSGESELARTDAPASATSHQSSGQAPPAAMPVGERSPKPEQGLAAAPPPNAAQARTNSPAAEKEPRTKGKSRLAYARHTNPLPEDQVEREKPDEPLEIKRFHRPVATGPGVLVAGDTTIHLAGIDPLKGDASCDLASGKSWPCGRAATFSLRRLIRRRSVVCDILERLDDATVRGRCSVAKVNINAWLVRRGWARPAEGGASGFAKEMAAAQDDKSGQWRAVLPTGN